MGKTMMVPWTTTEMVEVPIPPTDLPFDDGENMDSPWHRAQIELLINVLETSWKGKDFYCGGNMFVHFSEEHVRNRDFRGPDFFVVMDVDHDRPRLYWAVWEEEGRYPDVIVELISPTTEREDRTSKKKIYERTFRTPYYFLFDPDGYELEGWHLDNSRYRAMSMEAGRIWCESLGMGLGIWKGTWDGHDTTWLRFFDREGKMLPTGEETQAARADQQAARANQQAARANTAEAEIDRLRKEIEQLRLQARDDTPRPV